MYAKTFHDKFAVPLVRRLKYVIHSILLQFIEKTQEFKSMLDRANNQIRDLTCRVNKLEPENERLRGVERDYYRISRYLDHGHVERIIEEIKAQKIAERKPRVRQRVIDYSR
jgi:hypothetical protein